jgi:hypothetical protein
MQTNKMLLIMFAIGLTCCHIFADTLTNSSANLVRKIGDYSMMRGTNGHWIFMNPGEFWRGTWKENRNGLRTQLRVYKETNYDYSQKRGMYPVSTNLILRVEWGSALKDLDGEYYMTPNRKFAKFQLLDAKGNIIPPNPNSGTSLMEGVLKDINSVGSFPDIAIKFIYETNLPTWASPSNGSLMADYPKTISTNVYPRIESSGVNGKVDSDILGKTYSATNQPPYVIDFLKLDEVYSITNEGDYTLTVQPVLYKRRSANSKFLDRVDLPSVTTKVHLVPNNK